MESALDSRLYILRSRDGQAILSVIFLISAIIILTGLALVFTVTAFLNNTYGFQLKEKAQAAALSGVDDALLRLARDKDFSNTLGYSLLVGNYTATVTVLRDVPVTGQTTITSSAAALLSQSSIKTTVSRNLTTGQITVISWQQI